MKRGDCPPFPSWSLFWSFPQAPCAHLERGPSLSAHIQLQAGGMAVPSGMPGWRMPRGGCRAGDTLQVSVGAKGSLQGSGAGGPSCSGCPPPGSVQKDRHRDGASLPLVPLVCFACSVRSRLDLFEDAVVVLCVVPVQFREELYKSSTRLASLLPRRHGWQARCVWPPLTLCLQM